VGVVVEQLRRTVPGGIGTYGLGLLQGLLSVDAAARASVTLYASRSRSTPDPLADLGFPVVASRLRGPLLTRAWDRGLVAAPRRFDLVHSLSLAAPPVRHGTLVVTVHDMAWRHVPEAYPRHGLQWHEAALRRALHRASHFVVPSDTVATELVGVGAPPEAVTMVPLGSDHLPPPDDEAAASLLARLGVGGEFLLSVGTLEPRKNLVRLFDAYGSCRASLPGPWPLVVVGPSGWGPSAVGTEGVVYAGAVRGATLAALYRRARLVAYVPVEEGFGLPPLEAMHQGTPVVASPIPSTGGAALEVDPTRVDDIATALVQVATDDDLRARLSTEGRARAARLTWAATARAHLDLWESLR
jgi:glycosyltransferase involved in cell wall biosynthesis